MTIVDAAKVLGIHTATLRKWIRKGCPCEEVGSVGRTHASRVDVEKVKTWRAERAVPTLTGQVKRDTLQLMVTILSDCIKRDDLAGCAQITDAQAALVAVKVYQRAYLNITRSPLTTMPAELRPFGSIYLESVERGTFSNQRRN